jgi:hypothetical protein
MKLCMRQTYVPGFSVYFVYNLIYFNDSSMIWFGLWCLTPLSTIFQLYRGDQFYWWRKPEYPGRKLATCHKSLTNFIT